MKTGINKLISVFIMLVMITCMSVNVFADVNDDASRNEDSVRSFVERLYAYCLEREADPEGLNNWATALINNDTGGLETARGFFNSTEFIARDLNNTDFIRVCYNTLLDRAPDEDGLSYWVALLDNNEQTRDSIVDMFCHSQEFIGLCDQYGIINSLPDPRVTYPEACAVLDLVGWDLRAAYDWTRDNITYVRDINVDHRYTSRQLAHRGFSEGNGNCFVFSACFYELACALGYDAHQITGHITRSTGLVVIHSWVEIDIDGTTWVFDPEFEYVDKEHRDGWYFQYGRPRTFVYQDITRMN